MLRRTAIALALAVAVTACADNILKERPVTRAAAAAKATRPVAPSFSGAAKGESTVCAAYRRQLRGVRAALAFKDSKVMHDRELALEAMISDACQ